MTSMNSTLSGYRLIYKGAIIKGIAYKGAPPYDSTLSTGTNETLSFL